MKQNTDKTIVVFRKWKDGTIDALFPFEVGNPYDGTCVSYSHVGQHSSADYGYCIRITKPAAPKEYTPLKRELERIGYDLIVRKRANKSSSK